MLSETFVFAFHVLLALINLKTQMGLKNLHEFKHNHFDSSSVPEGKLMGVELIGVYKSGSINWG